VTRHLLPEEFDLLVDAEAGLDTGFGVAELRAHARGCPACAAELDDARSVAAELDALPRFAPSPVFTDRVMRDVQVFEPWHVALGDTVRRLVPESRPVRVAAGAGALASAALLTLVFTWLVARADVLAFTGDEALTRFRTALWSGLGDLAASLLGDAVRTAPGALVVGAAVVFVATLALAAAGLRAAAAAGRAVRE
jgi:hypothetical protein